MIRPRPSGLLFSGLLSAALLGLTLAACAPAQTPPATATTATEGLPPKLGLCASCHNVNGIASLPAHPHIAGQDAAYMRLTLAKYASGERNHAPMRAAVSALTQADLDRIVAYYAGLPRAGDTEAAP
ncbi:MAG: c-type cytochrome [Lysobacteraceae bacterium]